MQWPASSLHQPRVTWADDVYDCAESSVPSAMYQIAFAATSQDCCYISVWSSNGAPPRCHWHLDSLRMLLLAGRRQDTPRTNCDDDVLQLWLELNCPGFQHEGVSFAKFFVILSVHWYPPSFQITVRFTNKNITSVFCVWERVFGSFLWSLPPILNSIIANSGKALGLTRLRRPFFLNIGRESRERPRVSGDDSSCS